MRAWWRATRPPWVTISPAWVPDFGRGPVRTGIKVLEPGKQTLARRQRTGTELRESCRWDLNPGPRPYQGRALPTEPRQRVFLLGLGGGAGLSSLSWVGESRPERVMGIEPTLPAWKAGTLPLSYTRGGSPANPADRAGEGRLGRSSSGVGSVTGRRPRAWGRLRGSVRVGRRWVVQDSNLRRLSRQIYSLVPLTTWVTTRVEPRQPGRFDSGPSSGEPQSRSPRSRGRAGGESRTHNRRFTKPKLCQLSYASDRQAVKLLTIQTPKRRRKTIPPRASGFRHQPTAIRSGAVKRVRGQDRAGMYLIRTQARSARHARENGSEISGPEPSRITTASARQGDHRVAYGPPPHDLDRRGCP